MNNILLTATLLFLSQNLMASQSCDLQGGGGIQISCEDKQSGLQVLLEGGAEITDVSITYKNLKYQPNPEVYFPRVTFERVDESVFTFQTSSEEAFFRLMGLPKTFTSESKKLNTPEGAEETTGSFKATLSGWFNSDESSKVQTTVSCSFNLVDCPR